MPESRVAVIAGSKDFAAALAAPLAERLGLKPRIVSDPGQAFALCRGATGLLAVEYGAAWSPVLKELAAAGKVRVVAALPPAHAASEAALRALGVAVVPWAHGVTGVLDAIAPGPAAAAPAPPPAPAPAPPATLAWPADVPAEQDAESILCAAFAGLRAAGDPALDATLDALTQVEKDALDGQAAGVDPAPVRRAATLRYRVATALATAPARGAPVDGDAAQRLLGDIDAALAAIAALAPGDRAADLDAIRRELVKEAVDLSEAYQRLARAGAPGAAPPAPAPAPAAARRAAVGRVVTEDAGVVRLERKRRWRAIGVLVAMALLGGGYHVHRLLGRAEAIAQPTLPGLPAEVIAYQSDRGTRTMYSRDGKPFPADLEERIRALEEAAGRTVRQVAPGVLVSEPAQPRSTP